MADRWFWTTYGKAFFMEPQRLNGTPLYILTRPYTFRSGRRCGRVIPRVTDKHGRLKHNIVWKEGGVLIPRRRDGVRVYHYYDDLYLALRSRHHAEAFEDRDEGFVMLGEQELDTILRDLLDYSFLAAGEKAAVTRRLAMWSVRLETAVARRKVEAYAQVTSAISQVDRRGRENPGVRRTHVVAGERRLKLRAEDVRRILGFNGLWLIALTKELRRHEALVPELARGYRHLLDLTREPQVNWQRVFNGLQWLWNKVDEWTARPYCILAGDLQYEVAELCIPQVEQDASSLIRRVEVAIQSLRMKELRIEGEQTVTRLSLLLAAKKFGSRAQAGFLERVGKLQERLRVCSDRGMRRPSLERCRHQLDEVKKFFHLAEYSGDTKDWGKVKAVFKRALHCL